MWGGVSRRGVATIVMHKKKKLAGPEWVGAITSGKVKKAIVYSLGVFAWKHPI